MTASTRALVTSPIKTAVAADVALTALLSHAALKMAHTKRAAAIVAAKAKTAAMAAVTVETTVVAAAAVAAAVAAKDAVPELNTVPEANGEGFSDDIVGHTPNLTPGNAKFWHSHNNANRWSVHELSRSEILGAATSMNGFLWTLNAPLARAIAATMPS